MHRLLWRNGWGKLLTVDFLGDTAIDEGGPKRKYVSIVHRQIQNSNLFKGIDNKRCFALNYLALKNKDYELYGNFVWTILQGCQLPVFFSAPVTDYVLYGTFDRVQTDIEVVPDYEFRELLIRLENITDAKEFESEASMADVRFTAGYSKLKVRIEDKKNSFLQLHYIIM